MNIDDDAIHAIIDLANGDMRKCVNLLQSAALMNGSEDQTNDELKGKEVAMVGGIDSGAVYSCTGNPAPEEMKECQKWLMNDTFTGAYQSTYIE